VSNKHFKGWQFPWWEYLQEEPVDAGSGEPQRRQFGASGSAKVAPDMPVTGVRRAILGHNQDMRVTSIALVMDPKHLDCRKHPGGKIEPGESREAAIVREIDEETGVPLNPHDEFESLGRFSDSKGYVFDFGATFVPEEFLWKSVEAKGVGNEGEIIEILPIDILSDPNFLNGRTERGENAPLFWDHREPTMLLPLVIAAWEEEHRAAQAA